MDNLRIGQVANLIAVSTDTVRTWIDEGKIPLTRRILLSLDHQLMKKCKELAKIYVKIFWHQKLIVI